MTIIDMDALLVLTFQFQTWRFDQGWVTIKSDLTWEQMDYWRRKAGEIGYRQDVDFRIVSVPA